MSSISLSQYRARERCDSVLFHQESSNKGIDKNMHVDLDCSMAMWQRLRKHSCMSRRICE